MSSKPAAGQKDNRFWVLKRTGYPHSDAASLRNWLRALSALGVSVVCPAEQFEPNPRRIDGVPGDWVVYPYIDGSLYRGDDAQIVAAGNLLGRIHSAGAELGNDLLVRERLPIHSDPWRSEEIAKARTLMSRAVQDLAPQFDEILNQRVRRHEIAATNLREVALPLAACSWDFKASNLVFKSDGMPVLVDPDHGGRIPRIYDLACSALLFHSDCQTAPSRMFNPSEWSMFVSAYAEHIEFTNIERQLWDDVLIAAWMDEGLWQIGNWPEGWNSPHDRQFLTDLALNFPRYRLDRSAP